MTWDRMYLPSSMRGLCLWNLEKRFTGFKLKIALRAKHATSSDLYFGLWKYAMEKLPSKESPEG